MRLLFTSIGIALAAQPALAEDGAAIYKRCAACHLPNGAGVPGAYPPLAGDFRSLAASPGGRRYLALVVIKGMSGAVTVEDKTFRGVMPAQPLNDAQVASVLNHVATALAKAPKTVKLFTAAEIAGYRAGAGALGAADLARLHAGLGGK